jgi:hypothetical protein
LSGLKQTFIVINKSFRAWRTKTRVEKMKNTKVMDLFNLLTSAFSCLFYGLVATVVLMAVLYVLLRCIGDGVVRSIVFWITGVPLFILLFFQFSMLIGAVEAKSTVAALDTWVQQYTSIFGLVSDNASDILTHYIWRRVLWIFGFVVVGCILPIWYDSRCRGSSTSIYNEQDSSGSSLQF